MKYSVDPRDQVFVKKVSLVLRVKIFVKKFKS